MKKQQFKNNTIIFENDIYQLHYFNYNNSINETPILIVPPHAGRHPCIGQNIIDKCANVNNNTYAFELLPSTQQTKNTTVSDLIQGIDNCIDIIMKKTNYDKISIVGLCQGAWLSAVYTSLFPMKIFKYANFAGPINVKTGENNDIEKYMDIIDIDFHKNLVDSHYGIQPGYMQWLSFAMSNPVPVFLERWTNLMFYMLTNDDTSIQKWKENNEWYDSPQDLAGTWYLDCLENHFQNNKLYNGEWEICGQKVDMSNITCPVYLFGGKKDEITHYQQVFDMANKVSSTEVFKVNFEDAGHTKCFCGKHELQIFSEMFF